MKVSVVTLGCKVNQCESASIVAALNKIDGVEASEGLMPADVYILNTCSVTSEADRKSRQYISKMIKLNPDCKIIAIGCSTQNDAKKFVKSNVIAIFGTYNKVDLVKNEVNSLKNHDNYSILSNRILYNIAEFSGKYCCEPYPKSNRTRAFIKVQDGCNRFCTYCVIPYLRGRSRSRSIADIVNECSAIKSGEIVLTGIDISSFGKDSGEDLPGLVGALKRFNARKRIGSLECEAVTEELLSAMSDSGFCPHFHLSLQSGSGEVLRSMNRHYTPDEYMEKVCLIRKYYPLAGITTDVIVGFPTETDRLFDESVEFIKQCGFSDIHVFPYSSRNGTLATKKYRSLPPDIVKVRTDRLLSVKRELKSAFIHKNIGAVASVYVEDSECGYNVGYTENYIKVYSNAQCGQIVDLKLTSPFKDGIQGVE